MIVDIAIQSLFNNMTDKASLTRNISYYNPLRSPARLKRRKRKNYENCEKLLAVVLHEGLATLRKV